MIIYSFFQIIKFAAQNFWRNFWLSLVTITMLILTLFSITSLFFVNVIADKAIEVVQSRFDMSLYFNQDAEEAKVREVKEFLSGLTEVKDVKYISREEGLEILRKKNINNELIVETLGELAENPLGAVLVIKANQPEDYNNIMNKLEEKKYNYLIWSNDNDFTDYQTLISRIVDLKWRIRQALIAISLFFGFIAILVIFNTIRMAIYSHRHEIGIMKLVGASDWFIRAPFLTEGIFYALAGCLITFVIYLPLLNFIQPYIETFFGDASFNLYNYFLANFWQIFGMEFLIAVFLNLLSTFIALNKYLEA